MWKEIGKACEWKHPRTPSVRLLWDGRTTEGVLEILRTTRVGCIGAERAPPEEEGGTVRERGRSGPPLDCFAFSFVFPLLLFSFGVESSRTRFPLSFPLFLPNGD